MATIRGLVLALLAGLSICPVAKAQWKELPSTGSPPNRLEDRTKLVGQSGMGPLLTVDLMDKDQNARQHKVVLKVHTAGVQIVNSPTSNSQPKLDEVHLQYRLDNGPIQNSTSTSWTFENVSSGEHHVYVQLAASDNRSLGRRATLTVNIP